MLPFAVALTGRRLAERVHTRSGDRVVRRPVRSSPAQSRRIQTRRKAPRRSDVLVAITNWYNRAQCYWVILKLRVAIWALLRWPGETGPFDIYVDGNYCTAALLVKIILKLTCRDIQRYVTAKARLPIDFLLHLLVRENYSDFVHFFQHVDSHGYSQVRLQLLDKYGFLLGRWNFYHRLHWH